MAKKTKHSNHRKKIQKELIRILVYSKTIGNYVNDHKKFLKKKYNNLTDEQFLDKTKDIVFENKYSVQQWEQYINFMNKVRNKIMEKNNG